MDGALRSDRGLGVDDILSPVTGNAESHGEYLQNSSFSLSSLFKSFSENLLNEGIVDFTH